VRLRPGKNARGGGCRKSRRMVATRSAIQFMDLDWKFQLTSFLQTRRVAHAYRAGLLSTNCTPCQYGLVLTLG
jgi:hypothetical protein